LFRYIVVDEGIWLNRRRDGLSSAGHFDQQPAHRKGDLAVELAVTVSDNWLESRIDITVAPESPRP
jgi:hypothetical protein